jgi:DNA-binding Lrp family transcriptional regulator
MVAAVVLMRVARDHIPAVGRAVADIEGIAEVYSVSGDWDLVAIVRVADWDRIAGIVTEQLASVKGIERTHTLMAFRIYSKEDMERAFDMFE